MLFIFRLGPAEGTVPPRKGVKQRRERKRKRGNNGRTGVG